MPKTPQKTNFNYLGIIISLFFLVPGILTLIQSLQKIKTFWPPHEKMVLGFIFTLLGAGILTLFYYIETKHSKIQKLYQRYPEQPWKWRVDWEKGFANRENLSYSMARVIFGLIFALVPLAGYEQIVRAIEKGEVGAYFVLLFPGVGFLILVSGIKAAFIDKKLKGTRFMFSSTGVLGGQLQGHVILPKELKGREFEMKLLCVKKTISHTSKSSSVHLDYLWQDEKKYQMTFGGFSHKRLPVEFDIPYDLPETEFDDFNEKFYYSLQVNLKCEESDYDLEFKVPVFKTNQSQSEYTQEVYKNEAIEEAEKSQSATQSYTYNDLDGYKEFRFHSSTPRSVSFMLFMVGLIFVGVPSLFIYNGVQSILKANGVFDYIFGIALAVFPLIGVLMGLLFIVLGIGSVLPKKNLYLRLKESELEVGYTLFGLSKVKIIPFSNIQSLDIKATTKSGSDSWYDVSLQLNNRKLGYHIPCQIPDQIEALRLKKEIEETLAA